MVINVNLLTHTVIKLPLLCLLTVKVPICRKEFGFTNRDFDIMTQAWVYRLINVSEYHKIMCRRPRDRVDLVFLQGSYAVITYSRAVGRVSRSALCRFPLKLHEKPHVVPINSHAVGLLGQLQVESDKEAEQHTELVGKACISGTHLMFPRIRRSCKDHS